MLKSLLIAVICTASLTTIAHAQDSVGNVSKAIGDSAVSTAELSEAGVKVVAGAVALPFVAVGTVSESAGRTIRRAGDDVWRAANSPLEISSETVTAQPAPQVPYDRSDAQRAHRDMDGQR
ncbi:hypothetical protein [Asticcacaulis sp. EMRT-3]|uniref:hypothetical protein n=1 Tax=Asticcacaulis sp. EMRT-3 TaxID=3040349 RepID=UPI0024AFC255|nr:hypothetical protein [Asticcacaulis sp. EMRT-3]MDI7773860.1 hypothetical protein [Asticcacaulis sp. EMRT-3]